MKPIINDIFVELQAITPQLATIPKTQVFRIPQGYFEQSSNAILEKCQENDQLRLSAPSLFQLQKIAIFETPTGYFDLLYDQILQTNANLHNDNKTLNSPLEQIQAQSTLSIPPNYFNHLHDTILAKIKQQSQNNEITTTNSTQENELNENINDDSDLSLPILTKISKKQPFKIPENYFEYLHERILVKTNELEDEQINENYPSIDQIAPKQAFSVPNNYFEQLNNSIMQKVQIPNAQGQGEIIILKQPNKLIQFARYFSSAAAAIAVFIVAYQLINNTNNLKTNEQIAEAQIIPIEQIYKNISDMDVADIKDFINDNADEFDEFLEEPAILSKIDLDNTKSSAFIHNISIDDIKAYIETNGDEFDDLIDDQISTLKSGEINLDDIKINDLK